MLKQSAVVALATVACVVAIKGATAEEQSFSLTLKNHHFSPEELTIPANKRVRLVIRNDDSTPAEFESDDFRAEKVLPPDHEATFLIGPLEPGAYKFHDEYHEAASKSRLVAK
jgi:heme/copper-type cytochrome/quinol oxidase subunit 2